MRRTLPESMKLQSKRTALAKQFGIPRWKAEKLTEPFMAQLERCQSDEARLLLLATPRRRRK